MKRNNKAMKKFQQNISIALKELYSQYLSEQIKRGLKLKKQKELKNEKRNNRNTNSISKTK